MQTPPRLLTPTFGANKGSQYADEMITASIIARRHSRPLDLHLLAHAQTI